MNGFGNGMTEAEKKRQREIAMKNGTDREYVCPQCGPDPRGYAVHTRARHTFAPFRTAVDRDAIHDRSGIDVVEFGFPDEDKIKRAAYMEGFRSGACEGRLKGREEGAEVTERRMRVALTVWQFAAAVLGVLAGLAILWR